MDPLVGEIRLFSFSRVPTGWLPCDGRTLNIQQNTALYSLIGIAFGGDGHNTFCLPDLRGRIPVGQDGINYKLGNMGGAETVALTLSQIPAHSHIPVSGLPARSTDGTSDSPSGAWPAKNPSGGKIYSDSQDGSKTGADSIAGGSEPHNNMSPFLCMSYCIATQGLYPYRPD